MKHRYFPSHDTPMAERGLPGVILDEKIADSTDPFGSDKARISRDIHGEIDFLQAHPIHNIPVLALPDGTLLCEGASVLQYINELVANASQQLTVPKTQAERYQLQEWLNFVSTELHKHYTPLFNPQTPEEDKHIAIARLLSRYDWLDRQLVGRTYLLGDGFTLADAYLYTVTNWAGQVQLDLSCFTHVGAYIARVAWRAAVQEALQNEGFVAL